MPNVALMNGEGDTQEVTYWSSYTGYGCPGFTRDSRGFVVSIVLDAGVWKKFSGIELLIVYQEADNLSQDNVVIKDCMYPGIYGISQSGPPLSHRQNLIHRRNSIQSSERLLEGSSKSTVTLPICTVIFELKLVERMVVLPAMMSSLKIMKMVPRPKIISSATYRIAYRRGYPCTQACHSVLAFFVSNVRLRVSTRPRGISAHSLRILPASNGRPPPIHLPPSILRHIVGFIVRPAGQSWRAELRLFGSVCKSWSIVLDLFFEIFTLTYMDPPSALSVMRSVEKKPERARLIRSFSTLHYEGTSQMDDDAYTTSCRCLLKILALAHSIREVVLTTFPTPLVQDFVLAISQLRNIQTCVLRGDRSSSVGRRRSMEIEDLFHCISNWPNLRTLDLEWKDNWDEEDIEDADGSPILCTQAGDTTSPHRLPTSQTLQLECNLEEMRIFRCKLIGHQLLRFSQSPNPCLQSVHLESVDGLSNSDLLSFLFNIALTLKRLIIRACRIPRSSEDEEYALDAIIDKLSAIESITIPGDCISPLTISRKIYREDCPGHIIIYGTSGISCEGLTRALEIGGWGNITITWRTVLSPEDEVLRLKAIDIAASKGVVLRCLMPPRRIQELH